MRVDRRVIQRGGFLARLKAPQPEHQTRQDAGFQEDARADGVLQAMLRDVPDDPGEVVEVFARVRAPGMKGPDRARAPGPGFPYRTSPAAVVDDPAILVCAWIAPARRMFARTAQTRMARTNPGP